MPMPEILIRPAEEPDYKRILEMNAANVTMLSPMDSDKLIRMAAITDLFHVAEADGVVTAFLMVFREKSGYWSSNYLWFENHYDRFLYVDRIVVDRSYRHLHIGRMMYEKLIDYARQIAISMITAEIDIEPEYNEPSIRFHASMGFKEVGTKMFGETVKVSLQTLDMYFMTTARIGFSCWQCGDIDKARLLWGDPDVTRYICAEGVFSAEDITARLASEINCRREHRVQYWPIYHLESGDLIGCCGLHPHGEGCYELGFHLRPENWRQGYATEAAKSVIDYAFETVGAASLFAGHNPKNTASRAVLEKLGFEYTGDEYYAPTGLMHPSYSLRRA